MFVLPSIEEGFGFVFIEAMANGLPVVAADAGAAPEVVKPGVGRLCAPRDPTSLAENIIGLLENREERDRLGNSGPRYVLENFSFETFSKAWAEYLNKIESLLQRTKGNLNDRF